MPYKDPSKQKEYQLARYRQRRDRAIASLGSKCIKCGSVSELEIDHINPATKELNWARMYGVSEKRFLEELAKCQLLCKSCHVQKSIYDNGYQPRRHGTEKMYNRRRCRCELCRKAHAAEARKRRKRVRSSAA